MSDEQLRTHMKILVDELNKRRLETTVKSSTAICLDLFAVQEAVQQAIIDNNCQPL